MYGSLPPGLNRPNLFVREQGKMRSDKCGIKPLTGERQVAGGTRVALKYGACKDHCQSTTASANCMKPSPIHPHHSQIQCQCHCQCHCQCQCYAQFEIVTNAMSCKFETEFSSQHSAFCINNKIDGLGLQTQNRNAHRRWYWHWHRHQRHNTSTRIRISEIYLFDHHKTTHKLNTSNERNLF